MIDKLREQYLIFKARNGSQEAIGDVFDRYYKKIYRFIYFRIGSREEAEDIASDVFLRFQDYVSQGGEVQSLSGLLYRMARNKVIDFYRQKKSEHVPIHNLETGEENGLLHTVLMSDAELEQINAHIDFREINKALSLLKDEYREVILLHYINEMSVKELSIALEKTENNIRVLLFRALGSLRENLQVLSIPHTNGPEKSRENFKKSQSA